ncbi:hypothetical protein NXS19_013938 [Fusarium pseudograminearum]|nr:hypothetical protein NXS19_013938 [Fusarium pseudograminearum]
MVTDNGGGYFFTYTNYQQQSSGRNLGTGYTATSCCNACAKLPECQGTFYSVADTECRLFIAVDSSKCIHSRQYMIAEYQTRMQSSPSVILSNGLCGQWKNAGSIGQNT